MKKLVGKMVKGLVGIGCMASLCVALNGVSSVGMNDSKKVQVKPLVQAQEVVKKEDKKDNKEVDKNDSKKTIDSKNDGKKGVMVQAKNWLREEDDENKDLDGNVIIEDGNKTIEISKDTYDEIEHGENSDLKGDIYLGEDDIINVTTKDEDNNITDNTLCGSNVNDSENGDKNDSSTNNTTITNELYHQVKSVDELKNYFSKFNVVSSRDEIDFYVITLSSGITISYEVAIDMFYVSDGKTTQDLEAIEDTEDYVKELLMNKYEDSKNNLMSQYGEDTYKLMNQEEGIENEEQSFQHYVEYGI